MKSPIQVRTAADLAGVEAMGLSEFLPALTPYGLIERHAIHTPGKVALHYVSRVGHPEEDRLYTYAALAKSIRQAASLFRRLGVGPEDSVAILTPHIPQGQIALWAAEIAGRACPLNPMLRPDHIVSLLRTSKAKVAVVLGSNSEWPIWPNVIEPLRASGCVQVVLDTDSEGPTPGSDGNFDVLGRANGTNCLPPPATSIRSLLPPISIRAVRLARPNLPCTCTATRHSPPSPSL